LSAFRRFAALTIVSVFLLASQVFADDLAGEGTVGEWRAYLSRSELATAAYAAGVMAMESVFVTCKTPHTVRELHAYLLYRALPALSMKQAIRSFLIEANCSVIGEDRLISSNSPSKSTTDVGEY
jgi:hypothetical protein